MSNPKLLLVGNNAPQEIVNQLLAAGYQRIPVSIDQFVSSEPFVELFRGDESNAKTNAELLRVAEVVVVQSCSALDERSVSDDTLSLYLILHTLKEVYKAKLVTVVLPFPPFERQDVRKQNDRFPSIAIDMLAKTLAFLGADRVITLAPHSKDACGYWKRYFGHNYKAIESADIFADHIRGQFPNASNLVIGAPDGGNKPNDMAQIEARRVTSAVFGTDRDSEETMARMFRITKEHTGINEIAIKGFDGDVNGKDAILIDDMTDTGGTTLKGAKKLKENGANTVTVYLGHGILSGDALEKLLREKIGEKPVIDKLVISDSIPAIEDKIRKLQKKFPEMDLAQKVEIVSSAPVITRTLEELEMSQFRQSRYQQALNGLRERE